MKIKNEPWNKRLKKITIYTKKSAKEKLEA